MTFFSEFISVFEILSQDRCMMDSKESSNPREALIMIIRIFIQGDTQKAFGWVALRGAFLEIFSLYYDQSFKLDILSFC